MACPATRATGDGGYLNDAKQFFGAYQSSPESLLSPNLIVDWNNNFWSTAILLASQVRTAVQSIEHILAVPTCSATMESAVMLHLHKFIS